MLTITIRNCVNALSEIVLRVVPAKVGGTAGRRTINFKAADNSMTLSADNLFGFQRAMDNTPAGQSLITQMQGGAFKTKYHFNWSDNPFAEFELYRQTSIPGREEAHKDQFRVNSARTLTAALVTPYFPGRAVESPSAKGMLNAIDVITEVSFNF